jgi:hypothetical protein
MSHDIHNTQHDQSKEQKVSVVSFKNSFWLIIIIVGLFIAALNFIKAESGGEEGGKDSTEMKGAANAPTERADMQAEQPKQTEPSPPDSAFKASK